MTEKSTYADDVLVVTGNHVKMHFTEKYTSTQLSTIDIMNFIANSKIKIRKPFIDKDGKKWKLGDETKW